MRSYTKKKVEANRWAVYCNGDLEGVFRTERDADNRIASLKQWDNDTPKMPFPSSIEWRKYLM